MTRRPQPSLVPAHVGEALGIVLLGTSIIAFALLILAITVIVGGFTLAGRFAGGEPPPNVSELGVIHVVAGALLLLAALAVIALAVAIVVYDWRAARPVTAAVDGVLAVLALLLGLAVLTAGPAPDVPVGVALVAVGGFFVASMVVLVVQLRRRLIDAD
ncbi:MAG: hypothetical protein M3295_03420 [Chloroflexota bacterium]|nr:hypothetical protein [Chloroflexota bacterium]